MSGFILVIYSVFGSSTSMTAAVFADKPSCQQALAIAKAQFPGPTTGFCTPQQVPAK